MTVAEAVVTLVPVPVAERLVGLAEAEKALLVIVTVTSQVAVPATLSVTVHRNMAVRLSPEVRPVALKVVDAELELVIEIVPPESFVQAYV